MDDKNLATFAGGCFWCMEPPFEKLNGVSAVISGYAGGTEKSPSYEDVASGRTGHLEAVQIHYDPAVISYSELVEVFWKQIDPTDQGGQFVDRGRQYGTAIFVHDDEQKKIAERSKKALGESGLFSKTIVTPIIAYTNFYPAEDYHQDYYKESSVRYKFYRYNSGRDQYLESIWSKEMAHKNEKHATAVGGKWPRPSDAELRKRLSDLEWKVVREEGTERAFDNAYWNNKAEGLYVDIVTGEPLFSSRDKYDSGTGWPSFTKPVDKQSIEEREDNGLFSKRVEVRSRMGDAHLGHVFADGPQPTGLRYCINSASLRFVPLADLRKEGYEAYLHLFE